MVERTAVFPAGRHSLYAEHRYSAAIRSGDLLFVSGQVGSREDGTPEPDFQQQVRLAFDNLHATLAAAGCTFDYYKNQRNSILPVPFLKKKIGNQPIIIQQEKHEKRKDTQP